MKLRWAPSQLAAWYCCLCLGTVALCAEPRAAQVAGSFYPAQTETLRSTVQALLDRYPAPDTSSSSPRILISPHAGYPYSGPVAAEAFRQIQGRTFDGVVVIGFTHRDQFDGASVDDREAYVTPLGPIPVDTKAAAFLLTQPTIHHLERAHTQGEHSLEVMLPFLQVALGDFRLVPIMMGSVQPADAQALAEALARLATRGNYLFVFSTDLSHYHPYDQAVQQDHLTVGALLFETPQAVNRLFGAGQIEACGRGPILAALYLARRLGHPERRLLLYANSGDTTGDKSRVVGYSAIGFYERATVAQDRISDAAGQALVHAAREVLTAQLRKTKPPSALSTDQFPELAKTRGLFVTLRKQGELRGCIGRIEADQPLSSLLPIVALDAALRDPRFPPVTADELNQLQLEVSILTPPAPIHDPQDIIAGRDGVVLTQDGHAGVFLPQVWDETGWTRVEFLRELAHQKAGLDPEAWRQAQLATFQDQAFEEPAETPAAH